MPACSHKSLGFSSNLWEGEASYRPPSDATIRQALHVSAGPKKKRKANSEAAEPSHSPFSLPSEQTFPAPLVEEGDELYHDASDDGQSVQEWLDAKYRNKATARRRTVYVVPPPAVADELEFMRGWEVPQLSASGKKRKVGSLDPDEASDTKLRPPDAEDVLEYLQAFYHGLPVKMLTGRDLRFLPWGNASKRRSKTKPPSEVALSTGKEAIQVRCRPSPDRVFQGQLNLNDFLDVVISILPSDAYACLMLTHHDLYEDDEDDFCCGRAYGGSRVAVVSSARYRPELDAQQDVDREHSWPASHCLKTAENRAKKRTAFELYPSSAIAAGVDAFNAVPPPDTSAALSLLWLGRACKTASHELGHCFGIAHCTYYACIMQGTANIAEDTRQPPYLCPIDIAKFNRATDASESERYGAMLRFCETRSRDRMFAALAAWIRVRLGQ